jgi:hypothetical protein
MCASGFSASDSLAVFDGLRNQRFRGGPNIRPVLLHVKQYHCYRFIAMYVSLCNSSFTRVLTAHLGCQRKTRKIMPRNFYPACDTESPH